MSAPRPVSYRWPCSVPGCHCTVRAATPYDAEHCWALCRKHWPLVPRALKALIRRARKRQRLAAAYRLEHRAVRIATERALGI